MTASQDQKDKESILNSTREFGAVAARVSSMMLSTPFVPGPVEYLEGGLVSDHKIYISILFTGTVYGEYILALDRDTAVRLGGDPERDGNKLTKDVLDLFTEFLNIIVGESMVPLGKIHEKLTMTAPRLFSGAIHYPQVRTGKTTLTSDKGTIDCYFYVDRMRLDIATSYRSAMDALTTAHQELHQAMNRLQHQQAQLVQAEKMAAIGTMAAGVAHEINTPLAAVSLLGENLRDLLGAEPVDKTAFVTQLEEIDRLVARISKVTKSMWAFSKGIKSEQTIDVQVRSLIEDTLVFCEYSLREKDIQLVFDGAPDSLRIRCRPAQLSQALLNVLQNAAEAVAGRPEKWIRVTVGEAQGNVEIFVEDSGVGIPESVRGRIFDPFFTTKSVGQGAGLGLCLSKGIIEEHQGRLFLSDRHRNTCMVLRLPKGPAVNAA